MQALNRRLSSNEYPSSKETIRPSSCAAETTLNSAIRFAFLRTRDKDPMDHVTRNALQVESEHDAFTESRYRQFAALLPQRPMRVLDVGCNTGRGGAFLKECRPECSLIGLDLLPSRLGRLPPDVYAGTICGSA